MQEIIRALEEKYGGTVVKCTDLRRLTGDAPREMAEAITNAKPVNIADLARG